MPDAFRLDDDGTITIEWSDRAVTLRRPLFGEYEKLRQSLDEARSGGKPKAKVDDEARMWPRIAGWWSEVIGTLRVEAGAPIETGDLPTWLVMGADVEGTSLHTPFGRALAHWRSVPLDRGEPVTTTEPE